MTTLPIIQSTSLPTPRPKHTGETISRRNVMASTDGDGSTHAFNWASTNSTEEADKRLAQLYRTVLLRYANSESGIEPFNEVIRDIPEHSAFGKWRSLIGKILNTPDVIQWAAKNKVDLSNKITISPEDKCIVAMVSGKAVHFPFANFQAFPLLLKVAEALSPTSDTTYNPKSASLSDIAKFYGITVPQQDATNTLKDRVRTQAANLEDGTAFSGFSQSGSRSDAELKLNLNQLADLNNKQEVTRLLNTFPKDGSQALGDFLETTTFSRHSASEHGQVESTSSARTVSLKHYISDQNWQLPSTAEELEDLLIALSTPKPSSPSHGDFGGALSWPTPLDSDAARNPYIVVLGRVKPGPGGLLGYLSGNRRWEPSQLRNPRLIIGQILGSSKAKELGEGLQITCRGASTPTSANDYLLAAIHAAFELKLVPSRTSVAGFELAQPGNSGLTASAIVKRLADHLLGATSGTGHSRVTREMAPVAAYLLLSKRAPEFLIKDIPDSVTYGSQAWLTLSTAVGRIEAETPGATSMMSYADILHRGDVVPLTTEQRQIEQTTKFKALMDWGVANSLITLSPSDDYSAGQRTLVLEAFQKQMKELLQALEAKQSPLPMRKDVGAEQLFEALGFSENRPYFEALMGKLGIPGASTEQYRKEHGDKADFYDFINTKFIELAIPHKDFPGPYSLLDLHISKRLFNAPSVRRGRVVQQTDTNEWLSSVRALKFTDIFSKSAGFADVSTEYSNKIESHIENLKAGTRTTVKYLVSRLPADDLKFIDRGEIDFYREELIYDLNPGGRYLSRRQPTNNKPLVARCKIGSEVRFYEINPQKGYIERRNDLENNFLVGHSQRKDVVLGDDADPIEVAHYCRLSSNLRYTTKVANFPPSRGQNAHDTYNCARTRAIANVVTDNVYSGVSEKLRAYSKGATTFESEVPEYVLYREFLLNLIPLRSAIVSFSKGDFASGIGDLTLDILGFVTAGASVAAKVAKNGAIAARALSLVKIVGRAAVSMLNPLDGIGDLVKGGAKLAGTGINKVTKGVRRLRGAAASYDLTSASARFGEASSGTFKSNGKILESAAVTQNGKWYRYDSIARQPYGAPLNDFLPAVSANPRGLEKWKTLSAPQSAESIANKRKWQQLLEDTKSGPDKAAFENGYNTGSPSDIAGYSSKMMSDQVISLAINKTTLTPQELGTLARQSERLAVQHGLNSASRFSENVSSVGATLIPCPQVVYLSQVSPLSQGQCAALSHAMAEAIKDGKEMKLIGNLFEAAANPATPASRKFVDALNDTQKQVRSPTMFHGTANPRTISHLDIVPELTDATKTKFLMLSTPDHAITAGVRVTGAKKEFFLFDANYGLVPFPDADTMKRGLTKIFTDKKLPVQYATHSTNPNKLEFKVSVQDPSWATKASVNKQSVTDLYADSLFPTPKPRPNVQPAAPVAAPTASKPESMFVPEFDSATVRDTTTLLNTRGISDCSAIVILSDLKEGIYQKRTLMHLRGSALNDLQANALKDAQTAFGDGGAKLILVGGDNTRSAYGLSSVLSQEHKGQTLLRDLATRHPDSISITTASGIDVHPDGTFKLIEGNHPVKQFTAGEKREVFNLID